MKVKIKDGGIYRTVEIESSEYGLYLEKGYTKVVDEPVVEPEPIKEEVKIEKPIVEQEVEPIVEEMPKSKKKKKA